MKKLFLVIAAMVFVVCAQAQVGIGTTAPNTNAVLDIFSANKGFLVPRIVDTVTVVNPLEGMVIYNKKTKTPYYHDGSKWVSLGGRLPSTMTSNTDRITYQVTNAGFTNAEEEVFSVSQGVSTPVSIGLGGAGTTVAAANFSSFSMAKKFDINSKSMNLAAIQGPKLTSIEFKVYATGSVVPYLSYRFKNAYIESYQIAGSAGGDVLIENLSIAYENYGFKDWVNNVEFGYSLGSRTVTGY